MKKLYIYLLFVILGILIYILLNHRENFSIGAPYIVESEQMSDGDGYDSRLVLNFTPIHDRQFMSFNDLEAFFHNYSESGDQLPAIYLGEFKKKGTIFWNRRHFFIIGEYLTRFTKDTRGRYFPKRFRDFQLFESDLSRFDPRGAFSGEQKGRAQATINIETVEGIPELIITDINGIPMRLHSVVGSNSLQSAQYVITKYLERVNSPSWLGRDVCSTIFVDAEPVNMNTDYLEDIEETFRTTESLIDSEKCSNFRKILPIDLANVFQGVTPVSSIHMDINISMDIRAKAEDVQYLIPDGHFPGSIQCVIDGNRIPLDAVDIISSGGGGIILMYSQKTELPAGWARIPTGVLVQGAPQPLTIKYVDQGSNPSTIRPRELNTLFYAVAVKIFKNIEDPEIALINRINSIDTQDITLRGCDIINAHILSLERGGTQHSVAIMEVKDGTLLELGLVDATKIMAVFIQIVTMLKCLVDAGYYYIDLKLANILYKCYNDSSLKISFGDLGGMISRNFYQGFLINVTYIAPEWYLVTEEELLEAFPSVSHNNMLKELRTSADTYNISLSDLLLQFPIPSEDAIIWLLGVNLIMLFKYIRRQIPSIFSTIQVVNGSVDVNGEYTYTARTPSGSPVYSKDGNLWIFRNKTIAGGLGLREWVIVEASEWLPVWTVYSRQTQSTPPPENVKYAYHSIEGVDTTRIPPSSKWKNRVNEDTGIIINQPFNLEIFRYPDLKYNNREHYLQVVHSNIQYLIDKLNTYARSGLHDSDDFVSTIPKIIEVLQGIFLPRNNPEGQPLPRMNLEEVLTVLG